MDSVRIRAGIVRSLLSLVGRLPLKALYGLGDAASWFMRRVLDYRKGVIYTNIARAFPDKTYDWVDSIARQYYSRMGDLAAETIWFGGCNGERGRRRGQQGEGSDGDEVALRQLGAAGRFL